MFGVNMLARHVSCSLRCSPRLAIQTRLIHASQPVMKKKQAVDIDSLFDDLEIRDEPEAPSRLPKATSSKAKVASGSGRAVQNGRLSAEERQKKFNQTIDFVKPRIGRKPVENVPTVRNSAWLILLQMATSEAELKQVVDLIPAWKERGRVFTSTFSEAFIRRSQEVGCPLLALEVYGDYAKYNLSLSLPAARQLLHSLHSRYPIENLMAASALFGLYDLPPAAQDYVSCSIIVDACLRHNSPDSNNIAEALLPHLRKLQANSTIDTSDTYHRENVWVQKAMESIENILQQRKDSPAAAPIDVASSAPEQTASL